MAAPLSGTLGPGHRSLLRIARHGGYYVWEKFRRGSREYDFQIYIGHLSCEDFGCHDAKGYSCGIAAWEFWILVSGAAIDAYYDGKHNTNTFEYEYECSHVSSIYFRITTITNTTTSIASAVNVILECHFIGIVVSTGKGRGGWCCQGTTRLFVCRQ
jgi:hypothetical protein